MENLMLKKDSDDFQLQINTIQKVKDMYLSCQGKNAQYHSVQSLHDRTNVSDQHYIPSQVESN